MSTHVPGHSRQTRSREEEADLTLRRTKVSRPLALFITLLFLAMICVVPIVQYLRGPAPKPDDKSFWSLFPSWKEIRSVTGIRSALLLLPTPSETKKIEDQLEDEALLSKNVLPPSQNVMSKVFESGNEQVYMGRDKWLFAKAEVDYLTGKGFLDPGVLRAAVRHDEEIQPNPVPAIVDFHRQLQKHGITLIVMPIPSKATIHPERFARFVSDEPSTLPAPENASFPEFEAALKENGVLMYDPRETLVLERDLTGEPQYFPGDTHWTPQAMTRVAKDLANFIEDKVALPAKKPKPYSFAPAIETNQTDLEIMLKLPKDQTVFPRQSAKTLRVVDEKGKLWKPQIDADILLLGDSFTNIYSRGGYWGRAAGLGEHLSYYLKRPVDRIALNGGGATEIRRRWLSDLKNKKRDTRNTKVVIYEFATRSLIHNDWKLIDFSSTLSQSRAGSSPSPSGKPSTPKSTLTPTDSS